MGLKLLIAARRTRRHCRRRVCDEVNSCSAPPFEPVIRGMNRLFFSILTASLGTLLHAAPGRTTLQPADLTASSFHGFSASADGNVLAVGAPLLNGNNGFGQGSVYVYQRTSGNGWAQQARITAPVFDANDDFGISVALEGNVLVIGAPRTASVSGRVYEYRLTNGSWQLQQTLASPLAGDLLFGGTVAMNRGTLAVGSGAVNTSKVFVYTRDAATNSWAQPVRLFPANPNADVLSFGAAIAIQGDSMVIGAPRSVVNNGFQGTAYVYTRRNGVWTQDTTLAPPPVPASYLYGWSVAIDRGRVAVGAPLGDQEGSVFVYSLVNGTWTYSFQINAAGAGVPNFANFGLSVALLDNTLAVGAPAAATGTVTTFLMSGASWTRTAQYAADAGGPQALFGQVVLLPDNNTTVISSPGWSSATQQFLGALDIFQR